MIDEPLLLGCALQRLRLLRRLPTLPTLLLLLLLLLRERPQLSIELVPLGPIGLARQLEEAALQLGDFARHFVALMDRFA